MKNGKLIIFTAPSGAGKTTIVKHILEKYEDMAFSISATTRPRRANEVDGRDYYFISPEAFEAKVERGEFLEWEEVYQGTCYGTLKSEIERLWQEGKHVVFDIDVQGALNIKAHYGGQALGIFVKPPSKEILIQRLTERATEDEASLQRRIGKASEELNYENKFDRVLLNDDLDEALAKAENMVRDFVEQETVNS